MDESSPYCDVKGTPKKDPWQVTEAWPLKNREMKRFSFGAGESYLNRDFT